MDLPNENLVSILTDCRKFLTEEQQRKLKLPSIVVVGAESNGKSSLLQRLIGMELLPTDIHVCTRCPIEVSILNNPSIEKKFKLSITEMHGEDQKTITFNNDSEFFECENVQDIRGQVTSIVSMLSNNRIQEGRILHGTGFSNESIKIQVESSLFKESLSFTDLPGYNNGEKLVEKALKEIYNKILSEDKHSIVLWVHQATSTHGSTSINSERLFHLLGESWNDRVVGVLTKVDVEGATDIAIDMMTKQENGITWFAVMNKGNSQSDSFDEIEEIERRMLEEKLSSRVDNEHLGISSLRHHLSTTLIERTKTLFQGNKFNQSIKNILKECNDFLESEPEKTPFEQKFYEIIAELRVDLKEALLNPSDLADKLENPYKDFSLFLKSIDPFGKESLDSFLGRFSRDMARSGGLERSVSSSQKIPREFTQNVIGDIKLRADSFLVQFFTEAMENVSQFMEKSRVFKREDQRFVALFCSKMGHQVEGNNAFKRFLKLKDQVNDLFRHSQYLFFPPDSNSVFERYQETIIKPWIDNNSDANNRDILISVLSLVLGHIGSFIYSLISYLWCEVRGMFIDIVEDLSGCYKPFIADLAGVYNKKKEAVYDEYQRKKPSMKKKKEDLDELIRKYPFLFFHHSQPEDAILALGL